MPQPANRVTRVWSTMPLRNATMSSPSPSLPSQPIGPAYQPRSKPSCSSMSAERDVARLAADRRGRVEALGQGQQAGPLVDDALDLGDQVLHGPQGQHVRLRLDPQLVADRRQAVADGIDDDGVLLAILVRRQQVVTERLVLGRVGATPDGPGDGHGPERRGHPCG